LIIRPRAVIGLPFLCACAAVVVGFLTVAPVAVEGASRAAGCSPKGSKTVAKNGVARVFVSANRGRLYGCVGRVGRPLLLAKQEADSGDYTSESFDHVELAGRYAAWRSTHTDVSCKADCPPGYNATSVYVNAADLKRRRTRAIATAVTSLAVSRRGAVAWTRPSGGGFELRLSVRRSEDRLVDSGGIDTVGFHDSILAWKNAGQRTWIEAR